MWSGRWRSVAPIAKVRVRKGLRSSRGTYPSYPFERQLRYRRRLASIHHMLSEFLGDRSRITRSVRGPLTEHALLVHSACHCHPLAVSVAFTSHMRECVRSSKRRRTGIFLGHGVDNF
ncbi:hypothetical protein BJV78DRAFT_823800 [Lactifluus subvellereus]|nr:hypothetical protein BJV78DRAFT_823800 [Lactifluus subvellereus]